MLTGATGFVGGALLRALLAAGFPPGRVRCLVRDRERALAAGIPPECARPGDLLDGAAVAAAAAGADLVFHLAGAVKGCRRQDFHRANAEGTRVLLGALAAAAPGAALVHVSSLAAAGPSVDGATSTLPPDRCRPRSHYGESKRQGELAVLAAMVAGDRAWTILRPPVVYGPGDGATRLLFRQATAPLCPVPPGPRPLSVIHVDDLVQALLRCGEGRARGQVLAVEGPDRTTTHDLLCSIAAACGKKARLLPVPLLLARLAAVPADLLARLRGKPGFFSYDKVRDLDAPGWVADGTVAQAALDFRPQIALAQGLQAVARAEGFAGA